MMISISFLNADSYLQMSFGSAAAWREIIVEENRAPRPIPPITVTM
jgi:hypothetical protein